MNLQITSKNLLFSLLGILINIEIFNSVLHCRRTTSNHFLSFSTLFLSYGSMVILPLVVIQRLMALSISTVVSD